jgi:hypothetical protein
VTAVCKLASDRQIVCRLASVIVAEFAAATQSALAAKSMDLDHDEEHESLASALI